MTTERFGIVKFRGQAVTVLGPDLKPGDVAPGRLCSGPGGKITSAAYMPTLGEEPNYTEVLAAAQAAL